MPTDSSVIDMVMGFDPADALSGNAFQTETTKVFNPNIYKTNPAGKDVNIASEDGHYHSKVRVLLNPYDMKRSIVHQARYSMRDNRGFFSVISSLSNGDKNCPIFKAWKQLWYSKVADPSTVGQMIEDTEKKEWARKMFDKAESDWVLVQIIEDENYPELVGSFKTMKMPKAIMNRLQAKMNPTDSTKAKQPLMDYLFGTILEMNVVPGPDDPSQPSRRSREVNYDLCDFSDELQPVIMTNGENLFTDEELELIEEYNNLNNEYNKAISDAYRAKSEGLKAKAEAKAKDAESKKADLRDSIRPLYAKAIEYVKANAINIVTECGYIPWTVDQNDRVENWIKNVLAMKDPAVQTVNETEGAAGSEDSGKTTQKAASAASSVTESFDSAAPADDDLPF